MSSYGIQRSRLKSEATSLPSQLALHKLGGCLEVVTRKAALQMSLTLTVIPCRASRGDACLLSAEPSEAAVLSVGDGAAMVPAEFDMYGSSHMYVASCYKCIASSNKCLTSSNKKPLETMLTDKTRSKLAAFALCRLMLILSVRSQ